MLVDADALDFRISGRNLTTERGAGNQLTWHEHLEVEHEAALAGYRVCAVGHEPQHPFGAGISAGEPQVSGRDEWHSKHHRGAARHDQNAQVDDEGSLYNIRSQAQLGQQTADPVMRAVAMKAWPQRFQTILEFVRVHGSRPTAPPRSVPPKIGHKCR